MKTEINTTQPILKLTVEDIDAIRKEAFIAGWGSCIKNILYQGADVTTFYKYYNFKLTKHEENSNIED